MENETPATEPKQRDPKRVFIGMIMQGSMRWETSQLWEQLRFVELEGYKFITMRFGGIGLAKGRNLMTHLALKTDCGRMINIDSDMNPNVHHVLRLLSHKDEMVSGMYPKKTMTSLQWVGNFVGTPTRPDGLRESLDFGGGFCSLDLGFIERMIETYYEATWYESEDPETKGEIMHDLWSNGCVVDDWRGRVYPRYLTEDFYICYRARKMGVKVWQDTQCQVGHVGSVDFLELHSKMLELENASIFRAPTN
jgi:hypothetical protein